MEDSKKIPVIPDVKDTDPFLVNPADVKVINVPKPVPKPIGVKPHLLSDEDY